jgi:rhodanese-related sulfurtransferase
VSTLVAIDEISVFDLHAQLGAALASTHPASGDNQIVLIDVREDDEWAAGHVPGARHVPLGTVPERLDEFSGTPTYVICRSGGRSGHACEFAAEHGRTVVNVSGGMLAWADAGFEIARG